MKINNSISLNIQFIVLFLIVLLTNCKKEDNTNYLNNWQTIYQDTTVWMTNINFLDKNTGFVLANNTNAIGSLRGRQFIIKTINAGQTWVKYACLLPTGNDVIGDIFPLNSTTLIGLGTSVYKSIDNGLNWINLYPTHNIGCGVWDMYMKDSVNWQLADCAFITQTTDGGKSWRRTFVKDTFPVPVSHISFPSNKVGYACGGGSWDYSQFGFIIKTTDGGSNWDYINPEPWYSQNETFPDVGNIQFITEQTGFIFTDDGRLCKTIDGGNNWELLTKMKGIDHGHFVNESLGYCSDGNHIYQTNDGGKSWAIGYSNPNVRYIYMNFLPTGEGYAITSDNKILKLKY